MIFRVLPAPFIFRSAGIIDRLDTKEILEILSLCPWALKIALIDKFMLIVF